MHDLHAAESTTFYRSDSLLNPWLKASKARAATKTRLFRSGLCPLIVAMGLQAAGCGDSSSTSASSSASGGNSSQGGGLLKAGGAGSKVSSTGVGGASSSGVTAAVGGDGPPDNTSDGDTGGAVSSFGGTDGRNSTSNKEQGGQVSAGGRNNIGGTASRTGTLGGAASAIGGIGGLGGAPLAGGSRSNGAAGVGVSGSGGVVSNPSSSIAISGAAAVATVPAYNGLRGKEFNAAWKFNRGDASGAEAAAFDDSKWKVLDVPHDWSIELPFSSSSPSGSGGGYLDGGIGWYRKTFTLDQASSGKIVLIQFDGVYMNSQVWINGTSLGTRPYGYSSFEYDLTKSVKYDGSENVIAVKVNNNQPNSRFYSGSGIYRNVWLTTLNPVHIPNSGVFVVPTVNGGGGTVSVSTEVRNLGSAATSVTITTTITDASGASVATNDSLATSVAAAATSTVSQSLTVPAPKLWSVVAPYLYRATVDVKIDGTTVDTYVTPVGFRTTTFSPSSGFSLNGQNMKLQGVCMHHDLGALGAAINYRAIERQVEILKGMGVNAIRTSHNPPAPELLDIADRLGMMILDEAFDTWTQTKTTNDYGLYFNDWSQRDIQSMVKRDRNHPSVIMWSIGNEVGGATVATAQKLKDWVLALDKTRAITWSSNKMGGPHVSEGDDRNVAKLLDVVGYNYAPYAGDYDEDHSANPNWVILGSETASAFASRGIYHTPASKITHANDATSDKQCSSYDNEAARYGNTAREAYTYDTSRQFVAGSFVWTGFDYGGEPTPNSSWPSKSSYYGIVDTAGFPKDVYYFYQSRWTSTPMVHILPHWNWSSGNNVTVQAYSNCDSVELFLNDKSQGSKAFGTDILNVEWNIPWVAGTLRADCKKGGSVAATDTVKTAGDAAKIALAADRSTLRADGKDLVFVTADIQDADGVFVPNASDAVTFAVSGPGQLLGLDNGNPIDTTSYKSTSRKAFSGKLLAIVRSTATAGSIEIKASATGLTSTPLTVNSQAAR